MMQEGHEFKETARCISVWGFPCSPCVHVGYLQVLFLPPSNDMRVSLISGSKLPIGVNVCVSLYVLW